MKARKPVRFLPCEIGWHPDRGCLTLGPVHICANAAAWLREKFPEGGDLRDAWEACPSVSWLAWVASELAGAVPLSAKEQAAIQRADNECLTPDAFRGRYPFKTVERWLRRCL